jgi:hypothetical protein
MKSITLLQKRRLVLSNFSSPKYTRSSHLRAKEVLHERAHGLTIHVADTTTYDPELGVNICSVR